MSCHFACIAFAIEIYDDDIYYYELFEDGVITDEYCSDVMYFGMDAYTRFLQTEGATHLFATDHADRLCAAFDASNRLHEVKDVLATPFSRNAKGQQAALVKALRLPVYAQYQGYTHWDDSWIEIIPASPISPV